MTDLNELNERQLAAVKYVDGPLAILSVAGSGKTKTVTKKIEYLVNDLDYRPSTIWACTFTNKAADEMKERLDVLLDGKADRLRIATLHSTSFKILKYLKQRREPEWKAPKILVHNTAIFFQLLAYAKQEKLVSYNINGYLQDIGNLKLRIISLEDFQKHNPYKKGDQSYNESLHKIYFKYESYLRATNQMDFQDILMMCYKTMNDPLYKDDLIRLRERISYLIVDESQDTNHVSFKILNKLITPTTGVTIVGDLRQLIYSFQGASLDHINEFIRHHKPKIIDLNINYRSTKTIVETANNMIETAVGILGEPAITPNPVGAPIKYMTHMDSVLEGAAVHDLISQLVSGGAEYRDIAILYRVHSQSREVEDQLMMNDVPYIIQSNTHFYLRKEVKDIISYLQIVTDTEEIDAKDLKRIANRPTRYLSNKAIDSLNFQCFEKDYSLWEGMQNIYSLPMSNREQNAIDSLYGDLTKLAYQYKRGCTTYELVKFILQEMGYEAWAIKELNEKRPDSDVTLNMDALLTSVTKFEKPIDFLKFVEETLAKEKTKKKDDGGDYVKMMTVHASKGKEFKKVILIGVCDRLYPFYKAKENGNEEEEKRIMYVAQTRPQDEMYFSIIDGKLGRIRVNPSPYLHSMRFGYTGGSNV